MTFPANRRPKIGDFKDMHANILEADGFVCNFATLELREAVVKSAQYFPLDVATSSVAAVRRISSASGVLVKRCFGSARIFA